MQQDNDPELENLLSRGSNVRCFGVGFGCLFCFFSWGRNSYVLVARVSGTAPPVSAATASDRVPVH